MNISKKLKILLSKKNLTQCEFAKLLNTRQQVVQRWFTGMNPSHKSIDKIAKALNISVEDLLDDNKNFSDVQINISSKGKVTQTIQKQDLKDKEIELLKKEIELLKKELELRKGKK